MYIYILMMTATSYHLNCNKDIPWSLTIKCSFES